MKEYRLSYNGSVTKISCFSLSTQWINAGVSIIHTDSVAYLWMYVTYVTSVSDEVDKRLHCLPMPHCLRKMPRLLFCVKCVSLIDTAFSRNSCSVFVTS